MCINNRFDVTVTEFRTNLNTKMPLSTSIYSQVSDKPQIFAIRLIKYDIEMKIDPPDTIKFLVTGLNTKPRLLQEPYCPFNHLYTFDIVERTTANLGTVPQFVLSNPPILVF
jgi:hypothetical protein